MINLLWYIYNKIFMVKTCVITKEIYHIKNINAFTITKSWKPNLTHTRNWKTMKRMQKIQFVNIHTRYPICTSNHFPARNRYSTYEKLIQYFNHFPQIIEIPTNPILRIANEFATAKNEIAIFGTTHKYKKPMQSVETQSTWKLFQAFGWLDSGQWGAAVDPWSIRKGWCLKLAEIEERES